MVYGSNALIQSLAEYGFYSIHASYNFHDSDHEFIRWTVPCFCWGLVHLGEATVKHMLIRQHRFPASSAMFLSSICVG